jgi:hypothetical protein
VEHRRPAVGVDAQQRATGFESREQVFGAGGAAKAAICSAWLPMDSSKNSGPGCVVMRLISQESRGITHWMASGSAPDWISQMAVSIAVLPAPRITKRRGSPRDAWRSHSWGRAFGGTRCTPGATRNAGVCVDGTGGL